MPFLHFICFRFFTRMSSVFYSFISIFLLSSNNQSYLLRFFYSIFIHIFRKIYFFICILYFLPYAIILGNGWHNPAEKLLQVTLLLIGADIRSHRNIRLVTYYFEVKKKGLLISGKY